MCFAIGSRHLWYLWCGGTSRLESSIQTFKPHLFACWVSLQVEESTIEWQRMQPHGAGFYEVHRLPWAACLVVGGVAHGRKPPHDSNS